MTTFNEILPELLKRGINYGEAEIFDAAEIASHPMGDRIGMSQNPEMAVYVTEGGIEIVPIHNVARVSFAGKTAEAAAEEIRCAIEKLSLTGCSGIRSPQRMKAIIVDETFMLGAPEEIISHLAGTGGRFCVSLPGRENPVIAFADKLAYSSTAPVRDSGTYVEVIQRMLNAGDLQLDEEHHAGGAYWAFTLASGVS